MNDWQKTKAALIDELAILRSQVANLEKADVERRRREFQDKQLTEQTLNLQRLDAIGRLAGGVAHDFNTLTGSILGFCDLIMRDLPEDAPIRKDIEQIVKASLKVGSLTHKLLAFSRQEETLPSMINLNDLIINLKEMLLNVLGPGIHIQTKLASSLANINVDPGQMEEVILNILVNARDAMPGRGYITIETQNVLITDEYARDHIGVKTGHYVLMTISDTGHGMSKDILGQIFDPFFTTKPPGGGTGLGLSMVYGAIKRTGGNIWAYSEPGFGTTLKVYIPSASQTAHSPLKASTKRKQIQPHETILVVEDEGVMLNSLIRILKLEGYKVLQAKNGIEGLKVCQEHQGPIDLLLTDVIMPQMTGPEMAAIAEKIRPEMKVLYMSGFTNGTITDQGILSPSTHFISKPFQIPELKKKLRDLLDPEAIG